MTRKESKIRKFAEENAVTTRVRGLQVRVDVLHRTAQLPDGSIVNLSPREMQIAGLANHSNIAAPSRLSELVAGSTGERLTPSAVSGILMRISRKFSGTKKRP